MSLRGGSDKQNNPLYTTVRFTKVGIDLPLYKPLKKHKCIQYIHIAEQKRLKVIVLRVRGSNPSKTSFYCNFFFSFHIIFVLMFEFLTRNILQLLN